MPRSLVRSQEGQQPCSYTNNCPPKVWEIMEQKELMLNVLCFNCGVMFQVPVGTKHPTARCKECKD